MHLLRETGRRMLATAETRSERGIETTETTATTTAIMMAETTTETILTRTITTTKETTGTTMTEIMVTETTMTETMMIETTTTEAGTGIARTGTTTRGKMPKQEAKETRIEEIIVITRIIENLRTTRISLTRKAKSHIGMMSTLSSSLETRRSWQGALEMITAGETMERKMMIMTMNGQGKATRIKEMIEKGPERIKRTTAVVALTIKESIIMTQYQLQATRHRPSLMLPRTDQKKEARTLMIIDKRNTKKPSLRLKANTKIRGKSNPFKIEETTERMTTTSKKTSRLKITMYPNRTISRKIKEETKIKEVKDLNLLSPLTMTRRLMLTMALQLTMIWRTMSLILSKI
jgi:predicted DNA-binding protein